MPTDIWSFLADDTNRAVLTFLGGVIVSVAGAVWACFLLGYLRQRAKAIADIEKTRAEAEKTKAETEKARLDAEKSRAETEKTKAEIEINYLKAQMEMEKQSITLIGEDLKNKELDLKIRKQIKVSVNIEANTVSNGQGDIVVATVRMLNEGNEATRIVWESQPPAFTVRFVTFGEDGKPQHDDPLRLPVMTTVNPEVPAKSHFIRAGATEVLTFAFRPRQPGLYLLSFRGATDQGVHAEARGWATLGHKISRPPLFSRAINVANAQPNNQGLATVNPIFTWVRLAQRIPVRGADAP
jgi:hypothetical protein